MTAPPQSAIESGMALTNVGGERVGCSVWRIGGHSDELAILLSGGGNGNRAQRSLAAQCRAEAHVPPCAIFGW